MSKKLKLILAGAALAAGGCAVTMPPAPPMDAAVVMSQFGVAVTTPFAAGPVTGRNWRCPACYK